MSSKISKNHITSLEVFLSSEVSVYGIQLAFILGNISCWLWTLKRSGWQQQERGILLCSCVFNAYRHHWSFETPASESVPKNRVTNINNRYSLFWSHYLLRNNLLLCFFSQVLEDILLSSADFQSWIGWWSTRSNNVQAVYFTFHI